MRVVWCFDELTRYGPFLGTFRISHTRRKIIYAINNRFVCGLWACISLLGEVFGKLRGKVIVFGMRLRAKFYDLCTILMGFFSLYTFLNI